jgi:hypothetical protein
MEVSWTICQGWPQSNIPLISVSQVARITGSSHPCLAVFHFLEALPSFLRHLSTSSAVPSLAFPLPLSAPDYGELKSSSSPFLLFCIFELTLSHGFSVTAKFCQASK